MEAAQSATKPQRAERGSPRAAGRRYDDATKLLSCTRTRSRGARTCARAAYLQRQAAAARGRKWRAGCLTWNHARRSLPLGPQVLALASRDRARDLLKRAFPRRRGKLALAQRRGDSVPCSRNRAGRRGDRGSSRASDRRDLEGRGARARLSERAVLCADADARRRHGCARTMHGRRLRRCARRGNG